MRVFALIIGVMVLSSCAATYRPPETIAPVVETQTIGTRADLLKRAQKILIKEGFQILNVDEFAGIISTAPRTVRLTPIQADCGTTMGIDYLKDSRTSTRVSYGIIVDGQRLTVKANIEGEYESGTSSQNITLICVSRGVLEKDLLSKIIAINPK